MQNTVKKKRINFFIARAIILVLPILFQAQISVAFNPQKTDKNKTSYSTSGCKLQVQNNAHNPVIWVDFPDPSVIRVEDTFCMSNTTVHFCPGLPIMKSKGPVNWKWLVLPIKDLRKMTKRTFKMGRIFLSQLVRNSQTNNKQYNV
jgi:hypothetical protein